MTMKKVDLSLPVFFFIVGTRALLGRRHRPPRGGQARPQEETLRRRNARHPGCVDDDPRGVRSRVEAGNFEKVRRSVNDYRPRESTKRSRNALANGDFSISALSSGLSHHSPSLLARRMRVSFSSGTLR